MKRNQGGFTLIELVMVIVILGVLAAVALPKFVDLKGDAQIAATQGVAGGLASAMAINYAARSANSTKGASIGDCSQGWTIIQGGNPNSAAPSAGGYSITAAAAASTGTACTLTGPGSNTATFTAIGIS
jgi:MSHA pilin protein MshA